MQMRESVSSCLSKLSFAGMTLRKETLEQGATQSGRLTESVGKTGLVVLQCSTFISVDRIVVPMKGRYASVETGNQR